MPLEIDHLKELSVDALMNLLNPDFNIGKTYFKDIDKKFMITHNFRLIYEVNDPEDDVDDWETFGFPAEAISQADIKPVFGKDVKSCLINFFEKHPKLILFDIKNPHNYS